MSKPLFIVLIVLFLFIVIVECRRRRPKKEDQPEPFSEKTCVDKHVKCTSFAHQNYCNGVYRNWMVDNCRKSCGFCPTKECKDTSPQGTKVCRYWKQRKGFCQKGGKHYRYMISYCRATCLCKDGKLKTTKSTRKKTTTTKTTTTTTTAITITAVKCLDKRRECKTWRKQYCQKPTQTRPNRWYNFMKMNCQKTCEFCESTKKETLKCGIPGGKKTSSLISKIIGGDNAPRGQWRWQVAIYAYGDYVCGGSLITKRHVLTAGHCIRYRFKNELKIVLGDYDRASKDGKESEYKVKKMVYHENYDGSSLNNDVAILTLDNEVVLTDYIGLVCLPKENEIIQPGTNCIITGWGRTKSDGPSVNTLQQASLPILSNRDCTKRNRDTRGKSLLTENMLCAGYKSNSKISGCQGDSGGPLVCRAKDGRWIQHGVVSWGSEKCEAHKRYTVFARISKLVSWIESKL